MGAGEAFQRQPEIRAEALTLIRGGRLLIDGLSFRAGPGELVEIRGANGAGKTSLLRALAGFLKPRAGRIEVAPSEEPALDLHYLGHLNGLKTSISARAHARYWAGVLGGGDAEAALRQVGLERVAELPARALSQGQQRRLALTRLIVAARPIWLLDEPAASLDAKGKELLLSLIGAHRARGGSVLAAVHEPLGATPSQTLTIGA
jgi:heme exporter protein A